MRIKIPALCTLLGLMAVGAGAQEVTLQNDSLGGGDNATICPCFVAGEEAAVWLTSPCDGNIVAIQVFWRSFLGGSPVSLEDSLIVYEGGSFPNPGPVKDELLAPALQDGGLNEFRFEDENQTIPISIPVQANEEFVVSLKFFNPSTLTGPGILFDDSGITPNKNTVRVTGGQWRSSESLGVTGDWIIRVVVDCTSAQVGSVCLQDGSCMDGVSEEEAMLLGGVWSGPGSTCAESQCLGACEIPATGACVQFDAFTCDVVGGNWFGPGSTECVSSCPADLTGDGMLNFLDVSDFLGAFAAEDPSADFEMDGMFNFLDVSAFLSAYGQGCP
ncbi:MAG: GC-type dockerin domain-anchored protein [Phycisphaerales bacterium]